VKPVWLPTVRRTVELKDLRGILESLQEVQPEEVECFIRDLDRLEPDLERMIVLANAWSLGDIATLRSLFRQNTLREAIQEGCVQFSLAGATMFAPYEEDTSTDAAQLKKLIDDAQSLVEQTTTQAQTDWLNAAQAALAKNQSTFAVLPVGDVLRSDGHLEKLRELGYTVEEPL
jgi:histone deacetylase complex regulatory component SIN3